MEAEEAGVSRLQVEDRVAGTALWEGIPRSFREAAAGIPGFAEVCVMRSLMSWFLGNC